MLQFAQWQKLVDDYLHQAADSSLWPEEIIYDPDDDGVLIYSLGVHEHWNDSLFKQYTRNLGTGDGIELIKAHDGSIGITSEMNKLNIIVYPNPTTGNIRISTPGNNILEYSITDLNGKVLLKGKVDSQSGNQINLTHLNNGIYFLALSDSGTKQNIKIIKR